MTERATVISTELASASAHERDATMDLLSALAESGWDARIIVPPREMDALRPSGGVRISRLPVADRDAWGLVWSALIRVAEELAPCHFLMSGDPQLDAISPRLSSRIKIAALVSMDTESSYQRAELWGRYWDVALAPSPDIHFNLIHRIPTLAGRVVTVEPPDVGSLGELLTRFDAHRIGGAPRPRGELVLPPEGLARASASMRDAALVNAHPRWPDRRSESGGHKRAGLSPRRPIPVQAHRVFVSASDGAISGVEVFSRRLVRGLCGKGLDAKLLLTSDVSEFAAATVETVPAVQTPIRDLAAPWYQWHTLARFLGMNAPCIYFPGYDFELASAVPLLDDAVKVVTVAHSDDPAYYDLVTRIGRSSNAVVTVSHAVARQIEVFAPDLASRLEVLPYGVDLPPGVHHRARAPRPPLRILYAGRVISYQKRALDLIAIAAELAAHGVDFVIHVAGDGPDAEELRARVEQAGLRDQLQMLGALAHEAVLAAMADADVLLMTSAFEGLPLTVIEAMARGVVPVVSDVRSGVPELIRHDHNGLVAPIADARAFAAHLVRLAHDPALMTRLATEAQQTISAGGYVATEMVSRYAKLLERVAADDFIRAPGNPAPPEYLRHQVRFRTRNYWRIRGALAGFRSGQRVLGTPPGRPQI